MALRQTIAFAVSVAMARLLTPEEFGTVALLYLFIGIAGVFVDAGFSASLIQDQSVSHTDESTVFWFNLVSALAVALTLCAISPLLAAFYDVPILIPLTMVMALNVLIGAFGSVHTTILTRSLDFKTLLKLGVTSTIVSGLLGITLAWQGFGVWALAAQVLSATIVNTALLWVVSTWRPGFLFSLPSLLRLFGFGGYLFASSLLETFYSRFYTLLIGKFFGTNQLGLYNRADAAQQFPATILSRVLARVAFPIFSAVNQDRSKLKKGFKLAIQSTMFVNVPAMLGLAVVSGEFVEVVFGSQWLESAPVLKILCFAGLLYPLQIINLNGLKAQGHSKLYFRIEIVKKAIGTVLLIAGCYFGITGIALSRVVSSISSFFINAYYTGKLLDYGAVAQLTAILPIFGSGVLMAVLVFALGEMVNVSPPVRLLILTATGVVVYGLASLFLIPKTVTSLRKAFVLRANA